MAKTKVIGVRLPETLVQELDKIVSDKRYWKRNAVIEQILQVTVDCLDPKDLYDVLRYWRTRDKGNYVLHLQQKSDKKL